MERERERERHTQERLLQLLLSILFKIGREVEHYVARINNEYDARGALDDSPELPPD